METTALPNPWGDCLPSSSPPDCSPPSSSSLAGSFAAGSAGSTVPRELTEGIRTIETDPERASRLRLSRGQYRISMLIPAPETPDDAPAVVHMRDEAIAIPIGDELKRVWIYKLSLMPTDRTDAEGEPLARLVLVVHVLDNWMWLASVGRAVLAGLPRALPWIAGSVGSWFVVDKVESFEPSFFGSIVTIAAAGAAILMLWKSYEGK